MFLPWKKNDNSDWGNEARVKYGYMEVEEVKWCGWRWCEVVMEVMQKRRPEVVRRRLTGLLRPGQQLPERRRHMGR